MTFMTELAGGELCLRSDTTIKGGGAGRNSGEFFNEFLVVDISMKRNDQTIHTYVTCFQNFHTENASFGVMLALFI